MNYSAALEINSTPPPRVPTAPRASVGGTGFIVASDLEGLRGEAPHNIAQESVDSGFDLSTVPPTNLPCDFGHAETFRFTQLSSGVLLCSAPLRPGWFMERVDFPIAIDERRFTSSRLDWNSPTAPKYKSTKHFLLLILHPPGSSGDPEVRFAVVYRCSGPPMGSDWD
ncbi:helicase protein [Anopheles sinensis]|uniref:Helicase protein n=1 Tax=Anopheles sinensis TaxID=74873 RepID=A0A084WGB8_ANOSI|nr:helicase protein [Anopheles sinensis]